MNAGDALVDSYYEATAGRAAFGEPLEGDVDADVCIVGGGYTGISTALGLAEKGYKAVVLEARRIGWGASGRNGGQFGPDYSSHDLGRICRRLDGVAPRDLWDLSTEAVAILNERVERHAIDCDLQHGHLQVAVRNRHVSRLRDRCEEYAGYGYEVEFLDREAVRAVIDSERYIAGVFDPRGGHLHPLKYLLGLARAAADAGVAIHEGTRAASVSGGAEPVVAAERGRVRCNKAVLACNAYLEELEPAVRARIMPVATCICATRSLGRERADRLIANRACVADMNFVLDYYRLSADDRLLFGGRASYSGRDPSGLTAAMRARMLKVYPQLASEDIDFAWGGNVAITQTRFPDFGRAGDGILYAQGFSGHGVALAGLAGRLLAEAIDGEPERFDRIAAYRHAPFPGGRAMRTPLLMLAMSWYKLRDRL